MNHQHSKLNRREFLRLLGLSAGSAALYACGASPTGTSEPVGTAEPAAGTAAGAAQPKPVSKVSLKTGGWPTDIPFTNPTAGAQAGYNKDFQACLDLNPVVKVERTENGREEDRAGGVHEVQLLSCSQGSPFFDVTVILPNRGTASGSRTSRTRTPAGS